MSNTADIYVITCTATSKVYVGSSVRGRIRLKDHRTALIKGKHQNPYLQNAWLKYGVDCFTHKVVETCSIGDRWVREQWWINKLRACESGFGFNVMHSVQELLPSRRMSRKLKRYWQKRWQDEEYAKQRTEQLRGLVEQPGVREKMSKSKLDQWQDPAYRKKQTEAHKQYAKKNGPKLSAQTKFLWQDPEYRAKQMAERKTRFKDPVFRAKLSVAAQNRKTRAKWIVDLRS